MSRPARWVFGVVGALLLMGAPTAWYLSQPSPTAGELPEAFVVEETSGGSEATEEAGTDTEANAGSSPGPDASDDEPTGSTDEADTPAAATPATQRPPKPVSVSLPALGVSDAEVVEVGLDDRRAVEIPDDVQEIGWYGEGPRPGEDGNAFMTGHIDSRTQGRGVLFDLRRSEPGDPVIVTHEDGATSEWEVVARERIEKGSYPMEQVFRFDGPPGLVIDTCGGSFNQATGSYEQIDLIYAVPAGA